METLLLIGGVVLVGTTLQRLSGAGVGLMLAPVSALMLGPLPGVFVTNVITTISGGVLTAAAWRQIDWRRVTWLCLGAPFGVVPGLFVLHELPTPLLQIALGSAVLVALVVAIWLPRPPQIPTAVGAVVMGFLGSVLNVTVGVASPVIICYAVMTRWRQASYAASMQPIFVVYGLLALLGKGSSAQMEAYREVFAWPLVAIAGGAVVAGALLGSWLAAHVSSKDARRVAVTFAATGAAATVLRGSAMLAA